MPISPAFDREAYHVDGKTDLQVEREQAIARQKGNSKYGKEPEGTLLHMHAKFPTRTQCVEYAHELYQVGVEGVQVIPAQTTASHTEGETWQGM